MANIEIRCPSCGNAGKIEIDEKIINQSSRGVTAINIAENQICPHSFVAYIDKNLAVRDCFMTDFQIELPQMTTARKLDEQEAAEGKEIDIDLVKINIPALTLTHLLRAHFFKIPLVILLEDEYLYEHLQNFVNFIFKNTFESELSIEKPDYYKKNKRKLKKHIVLNKSNVLNDRNKILEPKKIKIERTIIQKFLAEYDAKSSLIIVKNEIQKAYELAKTIITLIDNYDEEEKLGKKKLIDQLSEQRKIKISFSYLEFLLDILKNYFEYDLSVLSDYYFPAFGI